MVDPESGKPIATGKAADIFFKRGEPIKAWAKRNNAGWAITDEEVRESVIKARAIREQRALESEERRKRTK